MLIKNYNKEYFIINADELEFDKETQEHFYEYWDGSWKRIFIEEFIAEFSYKKIETLQDSSVTLCKGNGHYFLLVETGFPTSYRVFFKGAAPLEDFIENFTDYINTNTL
jgi:hypothetical protein